MAPGEVEGNGSGAGLEARLIELHARLSADLEEKVEEAIARVTTAANAARVGISDAEQEADIRIEQVGAKAIRDLAAARDEAERGLASTASERIAATERDLLEALEGAEREARDRVVGVAKGLAEAIEEADRAQAHERRVRGDARKVAAGLEELRQIGRRDTQPSPADA